MKNITCCYVLSGMDCVFIGTNKICNTGYIYYRYMWE
jgi:translation initiation factor 2B subunit (eIF-2B alpha/beta/delta family)